MVKAPRDRFVAWQAGEQIGTITTPLLTLDADTLALNVDAQGGEVRVQITDAAGKPLPGFRFEDCVPITIDSLSVSVQWTAKLSTIRNQPMRLSFSLRHARLFAFETK